MQALYLYAGLENELEWWSGGMVEWWNGGVVEWWSGGMVEWWSGGMVEWNVLNNLLIANSALY